MANPLLPQDVVVTINGSVVSTEIFNYEEAGGERNPVYLKTMNRRHKMSRNVPSDYIVTFQATPKDNTLDNIYASELDPQTISLAWSGSKTITYSNMRNLKLNYRLDAEDRLLNDIAFTVPFYNSLGSQNRVVS